MPNELSAASVPPVNPGAVEPPAEASQALPSPLIDVQQGAIPAISLAPISGRKTDPIAEFVVQHFEEIGAAGIGYHETSDQHSVFYNPEKVTPEQIDEAVKAGKLFEVAPLVQDLGAPQAAPAAAPEAVAAPQAALSGAVAQPAANRQLETARLRNVAAAPKNAPNPVPGQLSRRAI